MGKQIDEYVREQHGETPWDRQSKMSEAGKGDVTRWDASSYRKYNENYPSQWKRPKEWDDNEADN